MLVALVIVPLAGAAYFAGTGFARTQATRGDAQEVLESADAHVNFATLRSALLDERNWTMVINGLVELDIPPAFVTAATGADPQLELLSARERVDDALETAGLATLAGDISEVRAESTSIATARERFLVLESLIARRGDAASQQLLIDAGRIDGAGDLVGALAVLELATDARLAIVSQLTGYFGVQFPVEGTSRSELELLAGQRIIYQQVRESLQEVVNADSGAAAALAQIESSEQIADFQAAIDEAIAEALSDSAEAEFSLASILAASDSIVTGFTTGIESTDQHLALVEAAASDVEAASEVIASTTASDARQAGILLALLTVGTLAFAGGMTHLIVAPLRRLAQRADRLRSTGELEQGPARGPREVRALGAAIDEAAAQLMLAEEQAHALAIGDLDHPTLNENSTGALGSSLREAVKTLARSLDDREEYRSQLAHEAAHDGLTGLPNRNTSLDHLRSSLARNRKSGTTFAVMFIDLDRFKDVNDTHGHQAGDRVLRTVSERLSGELRAGDLAGRLGGDEFLLVAEPVADPADAMALATKVRDVVRRPIDLGGSQIEIDCCVGVAVATRSTYLTADELLQDADLAVYKAKATDAGGVVLCDAALKAEAVDNLRLEQSIKRALRDDELVLHFQPIVERSVVVEYEALVRWDRPGEGLVPPRSFIPFAERSDLIVDIDTWVIERVAQELGRASELQPDTQLPISVNMSARHFALESCVDNIVEPLRRHGVDPGLLTVEVTESALLVDVAEAAEKLAALREAGISVALDDFGTGYTSLAYLRRLPIDAIKIDRSFVIDPASRAFIKLIVDTARLVGASVTAEGVETAEQVSYLGALGCDRFQGFYFGPPSPHLRSQHFPITTRELVPLP